MPDAAWLRRHVRRLRASYTHWTGRHLLPPALDDDAAVPALEGAAFAVVSHGSEADPVFNYGNALALRLFETDWPSFTRLPSRYSAEPTLREARAALLAEVSRHGYSDAYAGVRISSRGKRFMIEDATVWTMLDEDGQPCGQAARISRWRPL